jgi:hypothetical protein
MTSQVRLGRYESLKMLLGVSSIALALGWGKYIGRTVHFPLFPNLLDVTLGVVIGLFLIFDFMKSSSILENRFKKSFET